ncbi:outer membrane lipoprotein chaperone LolA [Reinekea marinisedimentorum]|uniref:Outer-membrane lipoprotein carrier protein n=1 Tax=Reinekea marinisedimentorum TaxID=230495 RepID=A0A4V2UK24_9GAMM|nr:outer membrane lipoprotein chaperone LolA [Reinekea marinisedimentorum]TCS42486.1 outer membrane lipoprotein carrier protein [Reinekea marinisedimentorum]
MKQLLVSLLFVCTALPAFADEAAKQQLIESLEKFTTVKARFEQKTYSESSASPDVVEGTLKIEKPLKFAWVVTAPYEQQVISDGETLWVYDPDLEQATYQPVNEQVQHSPAMILSQPRLTLGSEYQVISASVENSEVYRLFPLNDQSVFSDMEMTLSNGTIENIVVNDSLGQRTVISFEGFIANESIDASVFEFNPPPGTDLFEQM